MDPLLDEKSFDEMILFSTLIISMFITMSLIPILKSAALKMNKGLDLPDHRKVHTFPKPKVGGIAIAMGALVPILVWSESSPFVNAVILGSWIIVLFGIADDLKTLGWKTKLTGQILAAMVAVFYGDLTIADLGRFLPSDTRLPAYLGIPLSLLVIVGVTNAINLADGLDGLAGGIALLMFVCIAYLSHTLLFVPESLFIVTLSMAVIGAIVGFLRFNTYPATVFMGDTGSQLLGFLAITLALRLTQGCPVISPAVPVLLLGFPVLDTLTVMTERILAGKSPFVADKNHFHHKLMRLGLYHTEAVVVIYAVTALLIITGFFLRYDSEWLLLGFYVFFACCILLGFTVMEKKKWHFKRQGLFDLQIKQRLVFLKKNAVLIKASFFNMQVLLPLILLVTCTLPDIPFEISRIMAASALAIALVIIWLWILKKKWLITVVRATYYFAVPLMIYMGAVYPGDWFGNGQMRIFNLAFGLLALFTVLTIKFTRRQRGFKTCTMDFLILVIALVLPNLPDPRIISLHLGAMTAKIIVLYYSFEVLIGELRGDFEKLTLIKMTMLLVVAARGII